MARKRKRDPAHVAMPEAHTPVEGVEWGTDTRTSEVAWYWPGAIPGGSVILVEGRKCTGKSTVAAAIAACVTGGATVPGWDGPRSGRVLWFSGEDHWESVALPRLRSAGACLDRVARARIQYAGGPERLPLLPGEFGWLRDVVRQVEPSLVVLDPFVTLCGSGIDLRVEQQARSYLDPMAALAAETGAVWLLVRHLRKGDGGDAREAGLGSVAVGNVARAVLRCDEHPHERDRWVLSVVATNYARRLPTQVYQIEGGEGGYPRVRWHGACDLDADAIAEGRGSAADRDEWQDADRLLWHVIGQGWVSYTVIEAEAARAGVNPRTLRRAKERLGIPSRRTGWGSEGNWEWGPPPQGWPAGLAPAPVKGGGTRVGPAPMAGTYPKTRRKPEKRAKGPKITPAHGCPPPAAQEGGSSDGDGETAAGGFLTDQGADSPGVGAPGAGVEALGGPQLGAAGALPVPRVTVPHEPGSGGGTDGGVLP